MTRSSNIRDYVHGLRDGYRVGRINRRQFAKGLGAVGLGLTAMPLGGAAARAATGDHPTCFMWAGSEMEGFWQPYIDKFGELPQFSLFADMEEAYAKLRGGFEPDVMMTCVSEVVRWYDAGLLAPIDTDRLSNWPDIIPSLKEIDGTVRDGNRIFVPADWGETTVVFRADLAPEYADPANHTLGILWDPKYRGKVAILDSLVDGVAIAALYAGVDPWTMDDADIEKVRALLTEQRELIRFYGQSGYDIDEALVAGELVAAATWTSSYYYLKDEGLDVALMAPKEGALAWVCGLTIHAGTGMIDMAHEAIDAFIDPVGRAYEMTEWGYGSANAKSFDLVDAETLDYMGLPRDPTSYLAARSMQVDMKNKEKIAMMFEEVKAGF
jgi:spermidine/putrescine transport system substrate-binding protein